jgi:LasA protease
LVKRPSQIMHFRSDPFPRADHSALNRPANIYGAAWFGRLILAQGKTLARALLGFAWITAIILAGNAWAAPQTYGFSETPDGSDRSSPTVFSYTVQSGDSRLALAARFIVPVDQIRAASSGRLLEAGFLPPGLSLLIPTQTGAWPAARHVFPDGEVVYGPSAATFNVESYLRQADGVLADWQEYLPSTEMTPAPAIIERVALENSINPRLLLALLEYSCGCITEKPAAMPHDGLWLGALAGGYRGLYGQLSWAANQLSVGYYGWRSGTLSRLSVPGGDLLQLSPAENAGSVALEAYFAALLASPARPRQTPNWQAWEKALDPNRGFPALYTHMFGDAWQHARLSGPLIPGGLQQPALILPFDAGWLWSFTSGPHAVWDTQRVNAALDFAPASTQSGCSPSQAWITAAASGVVVRSKFGAVVQDLDLSAGKAADGLEQTGWDILYLHVDPNSSVSPGTRLHAGDRIGHPSCAGGYATGTNLHIARKYNGEWLAADGPLPFNLEGWMAHTGDKLYAGTLERAGEIVTANPYGTRQTYIWRTTLVKSKRLWLPILVEK